MPGCSTGATQVGSDAGYSSFLIHLDQGVPAMFTNTEFASAPADAGRVRHAVQPDDGPRRGHRGRLRPRRLRRPRCLARVELVLLRRRVRRAHRHGAGDPARGSTGHRAAVRLRLPHRRRTGPDRRLLRRRRPAGVMGGRRSGRAVRGRLRRPRLRHPARPVEARPHPDLGPARDRLRRHRRPRPGPERVADVRRRRPGHLRRPDRLRLPTAAPDQGHPHRAAARGLDLPRHTQRFPAVPLLGTGSEE